MIKATLRHDLPSGTVTFLFTDIEGSTALLHELGADGYAVTLARHRAVVRQACASRGGVEVDTQGDAFFVAFSTARDAVEAAGSITEELASGPIALRIGLHTGTPLVTEEGYVGEDVHFAARVAASGHGRQVVLSAATRTLLDEQYALVDLGEHRLKDIPEPVAIFQLGDGKFPPRKPLSNTNFPRPVSSFVGRERELSELLATIDAGARLVTLTGPGGSGKTRLALEAAAALVPKYKSGVFWVGLAFLRDSALVSETIEQTLGAKNGLPEHIGEREMLLLIDNLEQVIEAAPELSALLASCPNLSVIVTSRELLRVQGEVEYPVSPLADTDAVNLFCKRAQTGASMEISKLCRRLDNLPLAIELAAARTKALSPAQILQRVSKRLDLLESGRDADPRQLTLRATIAWSYDLLSSEEQQLFRSLSVFAGGCTLEAAEVVCRADVEALQSLIEKSLVRFANERYSMLETIRDFARERLEEHGVPEAVQGHAEYFLSLAEEREPELTGSDASVSMRMLAAEHDNLRAARQWFREQGDDEREIRLATTVWMFLMGRGYLSEGRTWLQEALSRIGGRLPGERTRALFGAAMLAIWEGEYERGRRLAEESLVLARGLGDAPSVARALDALALAAKWEGDYALAASLFEECRELSREIGDDWLLSIAVNNLGDVALNEGEYARATALFEESLTLGRKRNDPDRIARSLLNLATAHLAEGCDERALILFKEGLELAVEAELIEVVGWGLEGMAAVAAARGETERAATLLGKTEALRNEMGAVQPRFEEARNERILATAGEELGLDALSAATAAGMKLSLEDALVLAFHYE